MPILERRRLGAVELAERVRRLSFFDYLGAGCGLASLAAPWSTSIRPAQLVGRFGFELPVCWLLVLALIAAAWLEMHRALYALGVAGLLIAGWFVWAMWIVTTPAFTQLPFTWVGTDVIGAGWYVALIGFVSAAISALKRFHDAGSQVGPELWLFTVMPGFGLIRAGSWRLGAALALLFSGAFYFATTDSPDPTLFQDYGRSNNVPPAFPRGAEWALFGLAGAIWLLSIVVTITRVRREARS
jgi:hypothetical protein